MVIEPFAKCAPVSRDEIRMHPLYASVDDRYNRTCARDSQVGPDLWRLDLFDTPRQCWFDSDRGGSATICCLSVARLTVNRWTFWLYDIGPVVVEVDFGDSR